MLALIFEMQLYKCFYKVLHALWFEIHIFGDWALTTLYTLVLEVTLYFSYL